MMDVGWMLIPIGSSYNNNNNGFRGRGNIMSKRTYSEVPQSVSRKIDGNTDYATTHSRKAGF